MSGAESRRELRAKIVLVGAFAVGKTSLTRRFIEGIFPDSYHTTVGVKVEQKRIDLGDEHLTLVVWDLAGDDEIQPLQESYLRGAAGYLLVADGTRPATIDRAFDLHGRVTQALGPVPGVLLLNKSDLVEDWSASPDILHDAAEAGLDPVPTSAKTGENVEEAFLTLARRLVASPAEPA